MSFRNLCKLQHNITVTSTVIGGISGGYYGYKLDKQNKIAFVKTTCLIGACGGIGMVIGSFIGCTAPISIPILVGTSILHGINLHFDEYKKN